MFHGLFDSIVLFELLRLLFMNLFVLFQLLLIFSYNIKSVFQLFWFFYHAIILFHRIFIHKHKSYEWCNSSKSESVQVSLGTHGMSFEITLSHFFWSAKRSLVICSGSLRLAITEICQHRKKSQINENTLVQLFILFNFFTNYSKKWLNIYVNTVVNIAKCSRSWAWHP